MLLDGIAIVSLELNFRLYEMPSFNNFNMLWLNSICDLGQDKRSVSLSLILARGLRLPE